jgi:hypothetical protein
MTRVLNVGKNPPFGKVGKNPPGKIPHLVKGKD